jgi:hypothetical protein
VREVIVGGAIRAYSKKAERSGSFVTKHYFFNLLAVGKFMGAQNFRFSSSQHTGYTFSDAQDHHSLSDAQ